MCIVMRFSGFLSPITIAHVTCAIVMGERKPLNRKAFGEVRITIHIEKAIMRTSPNAFLFSGFLSPITIGSPLMEVSAGV